MIGKTVTVAKLGWWHLCAVQAADQVSRRRTGFQGQDASRILCCKLHMVQMFVSPGDQEWGVCRLLGPPGGQPGNHVGYRRGVGSCPQVLVCFARLGYQDRSLGGVEVGQGAASSRK